MLIAFGSLSVAFAWAWALTSVRLDDERTAVREIDDVTLRGALQVHRIGQPGRHRGRGEGV
jgi:hypothetical protein